VRCDNDEDNILVADHAADRRVIRSRVNLAEHPFAGWQR
jgi:hypothetical protein